ncbi:MAG: hypothetical protein HY553_02310 [Elusimicrobia bacterium]|nr:hypothetical protein [Elusimicrobiota bacterium]
MTHQKRRLADGTVSTWDSYDTAGSVPAAAANDAAKTAAYAGFSSAP